jgi:hypothetical protein
VFLFRLKMNQQKHNLECLLLKDSEMAGNTILTVYIVRLLKVEEPLFLFFSTILFARPTTNFKTNYLLSLSVDNQSNKKNF